MDLIAEPAVETRSDEQEEAPKLDFLAQEESPVVARLRARHRVTAGQAEAYHPHPKSTPLWVWITIAAGSLLALILLVIFLLSG